MEKVNKLYEVIIGGYTKSVVPGTPATDTTPATPDTEKFTYVDRVDLKNVVAVDVPEAISKVTLGENQHIEAVNRLSIVDAV